MKTLLAILVLATVAGAQIASRPTGSYSAKLGSKGVILHLGDGNACSFVRREEAKAVNCLARWDGTTLQIEVPSIRAKWSGIRSPEGDLAGDWTQNGRKVRMTWQEFVVVFVEDSRASIAPEVKSSPSAQCHYRSSKGKDVVLKYALCSSNKTDVGRISLKEGKRLELYRAIDLEFEKEWIASSRPTLADGTCPESYQIGNEVTSYAIGAITTGTERCWPEAGPAPVEAHKVREYYRLGRLDYNPIQPSERRYAVYVGERQISEQCASPEDAWKSAWDRLKK